MKLLKPVTSELMSDIQHHFYSHTRDSLLITCSHTHTCRLPHTHTHPELCCLLFDYHYMWGLVLLVLWGYFHWAVYLSLWCLWGMSCPKGEIRSAAGVESAFPYLRRLICAADKVLSWTRCAFVRISTSSTARSKMSLSLNLWLLSTVLAWLSNYIDVQLIFLLHSQASHVVSRASLTSVVWIMSCCVLCVRKESSEKYLDPILLKLSFMHESSFSEG